MPNPQIEDGHTKIANELMEAFCKINLSPYESRVLFFILRKTYGWSKKADKIPLSQIVEGTGMKKPHVCRALQSLISRSIVTRTGNKQTQLNKDYAQWLPKQVIKVAAPSQIQLLPEQVMDGKGDRYQNRDRILPKQVTNITRTGNKSLPKQGPSKANKALTKATNKSNDVFLLPEWINPETWMAFLEMRKSKKDVPTEYAKRLIIKKLDGFRKLGQSPDDVLNQSIENGWKGVFELKNRIKGTKETTQSQPAFKVVE